MYYFLRPFPDFFEEARPFVVEPRFVDPRLVVEPLFFRVELPFLLEAARFVPEDFFVPLFLVVEPRFELDRPFAGIT